MALKEIGIIFHIHSLSWKPDFKSELLASALFQLTLLMNNNNENTTNTDTHKKACYFILKDDSLMQEDS